MKVTTKYMEDRNMLTKDYLKTWEDMGLVLNIQGPGNITNEK